MYLLEKRIFQTLYLHVYLFRRNYEPRNFPLLGILYNTNVNYRFSQFDAT